MILGRVSWFDGYLPSNSDYVYCFEFFQVFPDAYTRRELRKIQIHCSNPACSWFSTYDLYEVCLKDDRFKKETCREGMQVVKR